MAKTSKKTAIKKAGMQLIYSLAFFLLLALSACQKQEKSIVNTLTTMLEKTHLEQ
jgi:hypothetical protein